MKKSLLFALLISSSAFTYAQSVITNKGDKVNADDLKVEPWRIEGSDVKATTNTQKIFQNANVGIGDFSKATMLSKFHVAGNAFITEGLSIGYALYNKLEPSTDAYLMVGTIAGRVKTAARFSINNCGSPCYQDVARNIVLNNTNGSAKRYASIAFVATPGDLADNPDPATELAGIDRDKDLNYGGLAIYTRNEKGYATRFSVRSSGDVEVNTGRLILKNLGTAADPALVNKVLAVDVNGQVGYTPKSGQQAIINENYGILDRKGSFPLISRQMSFPIYVKIRNTGTDAPAANENLYMTLFYRDGLLYKYTSPGDKLIATANASVNAKIEGDGTKEITITHFSSGGTAGTNTNSLYITITDDDYIRVYNKTNNGYFRYLVNWVQ